MGRPAPRLLRCHEQPLALMNRVRHGPLALKNSEHQAPAQLMR